jgi:hypothetical protein
LPSQDTAQPQPLMAQLFRFDTPSIGYTTSFLPSIDQASLDLHRAMHHFRPVSRYYASEPYIHAFNWDEIVLSEETEREW